MPRQDLIRLRRGTSAEWAAAGPVLASGEPGFDTTTGLLKVGNGAAAWPALSLAGAPYNGLPITSRDFAGDPVPAPAAAAVSNSVPGWQFTQAVDQAIVTSFPIPDHWHTFSVIVTWAKLAAVAGDVTWRVQMKQIDIFIDTLAVAPFVDVVTTLAAPGTNLQLTGFTPVAGQAVPGAFAGAVYTLRIVREGAGVPDNLLADTFIPTCLIARDS